MQNGRSYFTLSRCVLNSRVRFWPCFQSARHPLEPDWCSVKPKPQIRKHQSGQKHWKHLPALHSMQLNPSSCHRASFLVWRLAFAVGSVISGFEAFVSHVFLYEICLTFISVHLKLRYHAYFTNYVRFLCGFPPLTELRHNKNFRSTRGQIIYQPTQPVVLSVRGLQMKLAIRSQSKQRAGLWRPDTGTVKLVSGRWKVNGWTMKGMNWMGLNALRQTV